MGRKHPFSLSDNEPFEWEKMDGKIFKITVYNEVIFMKEAFGNGSYALGLTKKGQMKEKIEKMMKKGARVNRK